MKALFDPPSAQTEADTMPLKSEEMKAKIKAALERRVQEGTIQAVEPAKPADPAKPAEAPKPEAMQVVPPLSSVASNSTPVPAAPKSPREAAVPPTDVSSFQLPEPLASIPTMPKISYVPDAKEAQIQRANPLRDHLGSLDPITLLEKHVEAGADLEKLRVEVAKADKTAISANIESFSGVDTLRDLRSLAVPTVAVYGMSDTLLPSPDQEMIQMLKEGRTTFNLIGMEDTRHFPMLENVAQFTRLLMDFLEVPDVMQLEIKKTWERRVR
jgi:pimeloyl-ACP methyl ester carboxylesterase